jgi:hypothetical protein
MLKIVRDGHRDLLRTGTHGLEHEVANDAPLVLGNEPVTVVVVRR